MHTPTPPHPHPPTPREVESIIYKQSTLQYYIIFQFTLSIYFSNLILHIFNVILFFNLII